MVDFLKKAVLLGIRFYKMTLSKALPPSCRFYPTCSEYAYRAVDLHGLKRGGFLAIKRVLRCHPLNPGGYDPVPLPKEKV